MGSKVDIQQSLQQLKPMADDTILRGLTLTPETEKRILERIRIEGSENEALKVRPRKKFTWIILFAVIVTAGLSLASVIHSKPSVQRVVLALETSAVESSPVVALGALIMKDALRPAEARFDSKVVLSFAN